MATRGCDSAYEPTVAQARAAHASGLQWWGLYLAGPGALHNWSAGGTQALEAAGMRPLPIYVPAMSNGLISSLVPEADVQTFVAAYHSRGIDGAGVLDTEASMRGDPWTAAYERRFTEKMASLGQAPITYAGGFTLQAPPTAPYKWWIVPSTAPGPDECYQGSQGQVDGLQVDFDFAGPGFPLAHFGYSPGHVPTTEVEELFVRNPGTGEICLGCGSPGVTTQTELFLVNGTARL